MYKILIIEDEKPIADLLKYGLEKEGFKVQTALSGAEGLAAVEKFEPNVILLDIMLGDMDGLSVCKTVTMNHNIPIIMVTAKSDQLDKLVGLEYGADDYITKPFDLREVVLRIKSILRRITKAKMPEEDTGEISVGDVLLDLKKHTVIKAGKLIELTPKEFSLLETLMKNRGRVLTRSDLLELVWEFEYIGDTRTVDIHIQRLRKKLGDDGFITTVFGVGYKIAEEDA